jgi:hypothetical protein
MTTFKQILNDIKLHGNCLITIIRDSDTINDDFLLALEKDLEKDYKIEKQKLDLENIKEKTVVFIEHNKDINFEQIHMTITLNKIEVIAIVIRNYYETTNTSLVPGISGYVSS